MRLIGGFEFFFLLDAKERERPERAPAGVAAERAPSAASACSRPSATGLLLLPVAALTAAATGRLWAATARRRR